MPAKRRLPRDSSGIQESPYSKRSRRTRPNQTEIAERIIETIKAHRKDDGTLLASTFTKVPSKRQNPEYHEAVHEPIDLTRITQRMRMDEYRDIESLTGDIDLLVNNTKKYYEEDSTEFKDAITLWELYIDTKAAIFSGDPSEDTSVAVQEVLVPADDLHNKLDDIYNSLLAEVDEDGQGLTDMFMMLPDEQEYPDYYQKIKEPVDLTIIGEKISKKEYKALSDFEKDIKQLIKNAKTYNEPNSKIYNNATALKAALQDRIQIESEKGEKSEPNVKTSARLKQRTIAKFDGDSGLRRQDAIDLSELSVRSSRGTLFVQASITETTLPDKVDLQAKLYNEVVNYRNALGHSISDAFVRLPNKHQHPAYYEEIENPISFRTIRRNILNKKYENLEALEEDITLLIDNAKHYNEEKSQIYKNAVTLFNVMKEKLPQYVKQEEEMEGSDDGTDSENEEESNESDGESKKKKARGTALKERPQDVFRRILRSLYDAIIEGKYEGRDMISIFMEKPSRKDYPDYYKLILEPIDMKTIGKKIKQDKYPSVTALVEDFNLMFTNARHYNEPGSQVYEDAARLQEILKQKLEELPPHIPPEGGLMIKSEASHQTSNTLMKNMEVIYNKVRDYQDVTGREICDIFNRLPSKHELPDYYQVIKKPIENDRIMQKMQSNSYATIAEFMADMLLMFENACTYNEPGSMIYKDALILQKVAVDACDEVAGQFKPPDVQVQVQEILTNLFVSVINYQDEEGRCYSDSLTLETPVKEDPGKQKQEDQPMDTSAEDGSTAPKSKPNPDDITIDTIRRNLHAKRYRRLDVFQEHMFHVFEDVRKRNRTDCEVYEDAVELHRFFIRIRDELCKNGEILLSPALSYTTKHLQTDLDAEKQEKLPEETLQDLAGKEEGKEMREKVEKSTAETGMDIEGVTYQPGDFVYVEDTAEAGAEKPAHIVCIEKLFQDESGNQMLYGVWFYRPQDTYHVPTRKFLMKEVFKSDYYNTVKVSCIKGKCFVMVGKDYFKMKPVGYIEDDVYVCVSRYSSRMKSFKRIKVLNLPSNSTKIVQREKPLVPVRVLSVYAEKGQDGADTPRLSDMHGPLVKDNIPWPNTVINKERLNIKIDPVQDKQSLSGTGQTYFLQVNINNLCLKVGDSVYVQQNGSDKRLKIARIESMWSDVNGTMWFQGSWFAQPCETNHEPTRMFYRNEVFLLSFNTMQNDEVVVTNPPPTPLEWVVSVCSVLSVREMTQCRPTEILGQHIHVCESRYLVTDRYIKKIKGSLKKPTISHKVVDDEYYYYKKQFDIPREVSPQLAAAVRQELVDRQQELQREQEENRRKALEASHAPQTNIVAASTQYPQQMTPIAQPTPPRPYAIQQYPNQYQQVQYQPGQHVPQQQPYVQQQYMVQHHPAIQTQPQPQYPHPPQYHPGTPYTHVPQMVQQPSPAGTPISNQPQIQQPYQQQYQQPQPGMAHIAQSPMQPGMRLSNTPVDHTDTPGSTSTPTPTTTKKKVRGGHSTGYILFASECHPRMRAEHPSMPFGEISKLVGEEWRNQADEKKREYEERARELTAKAEAEGRPMQGKKKKKQQMKREMEEAAAAAQLQQQQLQQQQLQQQQQQQVQQHPPPQPHMVMQGQPVVHGAVQQTPYHPGQYQATPSGYQQQAVPVTPQHITPQQYPQHTPQMVATPAPAQSYPPQYATPVNTGHVEQGAHHQAGTGMRRGALFVKPPPKVQRVLHSEAYLRYIEGLEKGQTTISNFEKTLSVEEKDVHLSQADAAKLPTHWLANGKGQHESTKAALWTLRDLMLKDALAIKNHFA